MSAGGVMYTILVAEDDAAIAGLVEMTLQVAGYNCQVAPDGQAALNNIKESKPDLALLDIMLPGVDGYALLEELKKKSIPALFVTAKTGIADRIQGLRLGADDYITKPFEPLELLARVETVLRRAYGTNEKIQIHHVTLLPRSRLVMMDGAPVSLAPKEYELLEFFFRHRNIAYSRDQLLDAVWGFDFYGNTRTVDMHVQKLRRKLRLEKVICTVNKVGYRLEA
jgi:DNA-binding response OmpR family regulator